MPGEPRLSGGKSEHTGGRREEGEGRRDGLDRDLYENVFL